MHDQLGIRVRNVGRGPGQECVLSSEQFQAVACLEERVGGLDVVEPLVDVRKHRQQQPDAPVEVGGQRLLHGAPGVGDLAPGEERADRGVKELRRGSVTGVDETSRLRHDRRLIVGLVSCGERHRRSGLRQKRVPARQQLTCHALFKQLVRRTKVIHPLMDVGQQGEQARRTALVVGRQRHVDRRLGGADLTARHQCADGGVKKLRRGRVTGRKEALRLDGHGRCVVRLVRRREGHGIRRARQERVPPDEQSALPTLFEQLMSRAEVL